MLRRLITAHAWLVLACAVALASNLVCAAVSSARPVAARSDPSALIGTWQRTLTQADLDRTASFREEPEGSGPPPIGPQKLLIADGSFTFFDRTGFAVAQTTRVDSTGAFDVLAYIAPEKGAFCPQDIPQNASYTWALDGSDLVLAATADRCADRDSVLTGRWTRAPKTRVLLARRKSSKDRTKGFSWTERLTEGGMPVGKDTGSCAYSGTSKKRATCQGTFRLTDGTLLLKGTVDLTKLFRLAIVSGTGAYAGATGYDTAKSAGKSKSLITLHFA
jgi:hypothetical protein